MQRILGSCGILCVVLCSAIRAEVLYERELSEAEKSRYAFYTNKWDLRESEEELRKRWQRSQSSVDWRMVKVELLYDDSEEPPRPYIVETFLSDDLVTLAVAKQWREERGPRLTEGLEIPGFKRVSQRAENYGPMYTIHYEGNESIGCLSEEYRGPKGETAIINIFEATGRVPEVHELLHELLRNTIRAQHRVVATEFGTVLEYQTKWARDHDATYLSWIAPKSFIVNVGARGVEPIEIARIVGKRFPSSLPNDLKVDKTGWGRAEFELGLGRAKAVVEDPLRTDDLTGVLVRATEYVYYPTEWRSRTGNPYLEARDVWQGKNRQVYDEVARWWAENKENTYWDEKSNLLVAKGQSPADIKADAERQAREAARAAKQKEEAFLATPMTEQEIASATAKLIDQFETKYARLVERSGVPGARWRKVKDGEWVSEWPMDERSFATRTYTGPTVTPTNDRTTPLKGVFVERTVDPSREPEPDRPPYLIDGVLRIELHYSYHRLEDAWREAIEEPSRWRRMLRRAK